MFVENLHNQTIKAEIQSNLDVLCSISGRPSVDVIWQYKGGSLPAGVTVISESDIINDKLTTIKRRLTWSKGSILSQRRSTGGVYTCIRRVFEEETKQRVHINVHCKYTHTHLIFALNIIVRHHPSYFNLHLEECYSQKVFIQQHMDIDGNTDINISRYYHFSH